MPLPIPKAPKPVQKPVPKPGLFNKGRSVPIKKLIQEAKEPVVIPGTGGQKMWPKQYKKLLKEQLSYKKVGTELKEQEAKNILRQMRREDGGRPSRDRRTLEEKWGLKGKY